MNISWVLAWIWMWMWEGQLLIKREAAFSGIVLAGELEEMCEGSPESWEKSLKTWFVASRWSKALMVYKFPQRTQLSYLESFTGSKFGSSSSQTADRWPNVAEQTVFNTIQWNILKPENQKAQKQIVWKRNLKTKNRFWEERKGREERDLSGGVGKCPCQSLHCRAWTQHCQSPRTPHGIMLIKGSSCEKLTWHHYIREFGPKR